MVLLLIRSPPMLSQSLGSPSKPARSTNHEMMETRCSTPALKRISRCELRTSTAFSPNPALNSIKGITPTHNHSKSFYLGIKPMAAKTSTAVPILSLHSSAGHRPPNSGTASQLQSAKQRSTLIQSSTSLARRRSRKIITTDE